MALPIGAVVGDFDIAGLIHRGDAGFVYVASDRKSLSKVAVKEYLPGRLADRMADGSIGVRSLRYQTSFRDGMQGFARQVRILAELDEPALIKPLRSWQQNGTAYMAMPLCDGRSLEETFRDSPRASEPLLKTILGPLLDALATLHLAHCYPCDVAPRNIVLSDGGPLLFDLGIVRRIIARTRRDRIPVHDHGHAAIEQYSVDASMPEGPWTDVYAVASMLHLAITGNPPPSPMTRITSDTMPRLSAGASGYSRGFLEAVDRGLAVHPQQRPQSIAEFREALGIRSRESVAIPRTASATSATTSRLPQTALLEAAAERPISQADDAGSPPPEGEERLAPARANAQTLSLRLQTGKERRGVSPKMVGTSLIGIALCALALLWSFGGREKLPAAKDEPPRAIAATRSASPLVAEPAKTLPVIEHSPPAVEPIPAPTMLPASTLSSAVSDPFSPARERADGTSVSPVSAKSAVPTRKTGKIQFAIKPWGEIFVDGRKRGTSPPIKELLVPEGRHRIEVRNSTFSGYASEVEVAADRSVHITHSFASP